MSTMSDRELLELAAKAAGYQIDGLAEPECLWLPLGSAHLLLRNAKGGNDVWNPLTDDGDALRLAVIIGKFPVVLPDRSGVSCGYSVNGRSLMPIVEKFNNDGNAAVRRSIVRAAATMEDLYS